MSEGEKKNCSRLRRGEEVSSPQRSTFCTKQKSKSPRLRCGEACSLPRRSSLCIFPPRRRICFRRGEASWVNFAKETSPRQRLFFAVALIGFCILNEELRCSEVYSSPRRTLRFFINPPSFSPFLQFQTLASKEFLCLFFNFSPFSLKILVPFHSLTSLNNHAPFNCLGLTHF